MIEKRYDVLGFGAVAVDDILTVGQFPQPDGKTPVLAKQRCGGGLAGTALVAVARLGFQAAYCGVLDDDDLSRFTLAELVREGVDCTPVAKRPGARPFHSTIILTQGSPGRSILFSNQGVVEPAADQVTAELLLSARVLFVDYTVPETALRAARVARPAGIPLVADLESVQFAGRDEFLAAADHLILGIEIARQLTGEMKPPDCVRALDGPGRTAVVVTAGEQGCWYALRGESPRHQPALKVEAVDTTGCGDVFHGAYAASLAWKGDVHLAVRMAAIAAGLKATQPGGRLGIPDRQTVLSLLDRI